ncbi:hypothetical protein J1N35_025761 [Gossypium stocksii]|uniref:SPX domain-containing protein n=1 Tax=Gossypium stocksii TaxID=47602 RepID=A0A9D3V880_9ROSI|nr:hypothetical protein J1N35_025761 [Gossypium stocksii]
MKFGKRLKQKIEETFPTWRDQFLCYKELKKFIKLISSALPVVAKPTKYGNAEAEFMYMLNNEIDKFNAFFMEQEEDFIIRHKELQQRIKRVTDKWSSNGSRTEYNDEMGEIRKDIVDFHGEMVLFRELQQHQFHGVGKDIEEI